MVLDTLICVSSVATNCTFILSQLPEWTLVSRESRKKQGWMNTNASFLEKYLNSMPLWYVNSMNYVVLGKNTFWMLVTCDLCCCFCELLVHMSSVFFSLLTFFCFDLQEFLVSSTYWSFVGYVNWRFVLSLLWLSVVASLWGGHSVLLFWYSHPSLVSSHSDSGLVWVTKRV